MTRYVETFATNDTATWGLIFRETCNGSFGWYVMGFSKWIKHSPAVVDDFGDLVPVH